MAAAVLQRRLAERLVACAGAPARGWAGRARRGRGRGAGRRRLKPPARPPRAEGPGARRAAAAPRARGAGVVLAAGWTPDEGYSVGAEVVFADRGRGRRRLPGPGPRPNAAGGLNPDFDPADLMVLIDDISSCSTTRCARARLRRPAPRLRPGPRAAAVQAGRPRASPSARACTGPPLRPLDETPARSPCSALACSMPSHV